LKVSESTVLGVAMLKLRSLALELTPRCNQQCLYCYNPWRREPTGATEELSTEEICGLVDKVLEEAELEHLTLTGGEPLMRRDLFEIVDYVNGCGLSVVLISNGGLIDEKAAQMLAVRDVQYVQVTFAGPEAHIHDALCGMGSFLGASSGVTNLVAAGVPVGGSFLCTRQNSLVAQTTLGQLNGTGLIFGQSSFSFLGRPRERSVDWSPSWSAVVLTHPSPPYGWPRRTLRRIASNSASVGGSLTRSSQVRGRGNGHRLSHLRSSAFPCTRRQRLDQRQSSARATKFARSAFRST